MPRPFASLDRGKWHLGSDEDRFPTHQGFDEWYGIPRTYDEAMWPSFNETKSVWPSVGNKQGWNAKVVHPEHIYEARKGEKARQIAELNVDRRRTMEAEITTRAVEFIKRNASAGKPSMPTLPSRWFTCRRCQIWSSPAKPATAIGPIAWQGTNGPWRGSYFTTMEGSLRTPFIIRWPGKMPAGRVNNEIVHIVDTFTTLARVGGTEVPKDRPMDGVDQLDFFLGKQENSNREGFPAYVADRLSAVKWRNWKAHFIWQENMYDTPQILPLPKLINLLTDMKEECDTAAKNSWVLDPMVRIVAEFEASLKKYPPIKLGTPDPYTPPTK